MQYKLYALRKKKYTQDEMAKILSISRNSYINKEQSKTAFTSDEMFILSKLFGKTMEEIFLPRCHQIGNKKHRKKLK
ncbi:helix-turn-helix domain-containing protein [Staphylococcus schleiferi subsp. coagulans]|uniref:Helix-turn-helix domain-containing protein n=1 Tax=Staphylococcus coagulans TaxID=74706 RepID=A0A9X0TMZ3_9STAP|nr:helix-turn-helix domain-containing protein [Staphylococcus coagulans]MBA8777668.1 helix-turn-helix domain-containing protein [Staphylococcus coagulans]